MTVSSDRNWKSLQEDFHANIEASHRDGFDPEGDRLKRIEDTPRRPLSSTFWWEDPGEPLIAKERIEPTSKPVQD